MATCMNMIPAACETTQCTISVCQHFCNEVLQASYPKAMSTASSWTRCLDMPLTIPMPMPI